MTDADTTTTEASSQQGLRVGVIGDVHGHAKELYEMLGAMEAHGVDRIILLGDLVDRGPKSKDCLRIGLTCEFEARDGSHRKVEVVKGNHEDAYARVARKEPKPGCKRVHGPEEAGLFHSFSKNDLASMHELPVTIRIPELDLICIHGGFEPHCTDPNDHWNCRVRYLDKGGNSLPATRTSETFWADVYDGRFGFAMFGHESHRKPTRYPHAMAVDGEGYQRMHGMIVSNEPGDERFTPFTVKYDQGLVETRIDDSDKADRVHDWRNQSLSWGSLTTGRRQRTIGMTRPRFENYDIAHDIAAVDARAAEFEDEFEDDGGAHEFLYVDDSGQEHEWADLIDLLTESEIETHFTRVPRDEWDDVEDDWETVGDVGIPASWEEIEPGVYRPLFDI